LSNQFQINKDFLNNYEVIGIDEIHNLYKLSDNFQLTANELFDNIICSSIKYRWGITGTPFVSDSSLFHIINFLSGHKFINERFPNSPHIQDKFMKLFLKNCKIDMTEYAWPELTIEDVYVKLDVVQQRIYDAERMLYNTTNLRKLICEINLMSENSEIKTPAELKQFGIQRYNQLYQAEVLKLDELENQLQNIINNKDTFEPIEYNLRVKHFESLIETQTEITKKHKKICDFFMESIEKINHIFDESRIIEDNSCPICLLEYTPPITYFKNCGHYFCKSCIDSMNNFNTHLKYNCPLCRGQSTEDDIIHVNTIGDINNSSKIHELLKIITDGKYIIFTQFDKVIDKIDSYLVRNNITAAAIDNYVDEQILLLSSEQNAEGIDLSHFDKMIIFEPFENNLYCKEIEIQLIARIHRIGRTEPVIIYRFITEGTIEEEIYSKMK
jgi:SNF2 family DNA or RNA helicase